MDYLYKIADINILCKVPFSLTIRYEAEQFLHPVFQDGEIPVLDAICKFIPVKSLPSDKLEGYRQVCQYYVETEEEWKIFHCPAPDEMPYACTVWDRSHLGTISCFYLIGKEDYLNYSHNLNDVLGLEILLRQFHGAVIHSSFIRWKNHGIIFSAPSGTGKSTQANLWVKYEAADIINEDRAAIRLKNDKWIVYGLPIAGSSNIYRNESAPLTAIIVLRQNKENHIRKLRPAETVAYLYPEIAMHRWDEEFINFIVDMIAKLLAEVPVFLLECKPDKGAVDLVKRMIENSQGEVVEESD